MKKVTISLVTYNSARYLPDLCDSLRSQTFVDWDLIVVDNNSFDASASIMREQFPGAKVVTQKANLGFARAHNMIIGWSRAPYVLVINPDIVMKRDCLETLVAAMDSYEDAAEVGGKLLYWDIDTHTTTELIDSFGLAISANYKVSDRLQGERDRPAENQAVFGISGALALLRREALEAVRIPRGSGYEYFDEDFFAYKEDVDLAWRLVSAGWKNYFIPDAVAYHHRSIAGTRASWNDRKQRSEINRYSYRNHALMVYKNQSWRLTIRHLMRVVWFETGKFIYLLALDGSSVRGLYEAIRLLPRFARKRRYARKQRRAQPREFPQWFHTA
ncbi:MAG: glycosyltransferase family 2 protein [Candidatus Komeilibacteria bacterium]|nr:glycosyltransferase family 2 protein [Candidatus Komeilibacteria bacterium]